MLGPRPRDFYFFPGTWVIKKEWIFSESYSKWEGSLIRNRLLLIRILNEILISLWFISGSVSLFFPAAMEMGRWFFIAGSVQMLVKNVIRLVRHFGLRFGSRALNPSASASPARSHRERQQNRWRS
ncbi:YrhK family protein [Paenibacillus physcomitrellae]|uniref:YrhK family protein n=1 Tax=Paenibacillus physcomitrellae TaxID=1619311 RepID=UPI000B8C8EF3